MTSTRESRAAALPAELRETLRRRLAGQARRADAIPPADRTRQLPLSSAQRRLWFLHQMRPETAEYHSALALRLTGPLDVAALSAAVRELPARHEALRTTFDEADGVPVQIVRPAGDAELRIVASADPGPVLAGEYARPFDLRRGPLLRALLVRVSESEHVLLLVAHHIVTDGESMTILATELARAYAGQTLTPPPVQYADYSVWQRDRDSAEDLKEHLAYWTRRLDGLTPLDLPTDRPRPNKRTAAGDAHHFTVPADVARRLRNVATANGTTLFTVLLAAAQVWCARYCGQEDVAVGTAVSGRHRPELRGTVGFFVNTVVLRSAVDPQRTFAGFLTEVAGDALDAFGHAEVPFDRLVDTVRAPRDLSRNPLFDVMVAWQDAPRRRAEFGGLHAEDVEVARGAAAFDLTLEFTGRDDGAIGGRLEYSTDLFDGRTAARMAGHLRTLLAAVASGPDQRLADLPLADEAERRLVLREWNDTSGAGLASPIEAIEAQARLAPDADAVACGDTVLSYRELQTRANLLARAMTRRGAGPGAVVAVALPFSARFVVALLAVLKAGAAWLPAGPDGLPEDCAVQPDLLLGDEDLPGIPLLTENDDLPDGERLDVVPAPGHPACVVPPDGTVVTYGEVAGLLAWAGAEFGPGGLSNVVACPPAHPGAAIFSLLSPLTVGGRVRLASDSLTPGESGEPTVSLLTAAPATLAGLLASGAEPATGAVDTIVVCGPPLPADLPEPDLAELIRNAWPEAGIVNVSGPGALAGFALASYTAAEGGDRTPPAGKPIGRPIAGCRAYVLDPWLRPVPVGARGELYLGGPALAGGFARRPGLTARRFIADPFGGPGARMYRTGDVVRWNDDGEIVPGYLPRDEAPAVTPSPGHGARALMRRLADVWADVLGLDSVGSEDNFFDLGGDSILSMRVVSRAREAGLPVSAEDIFRHQTVAGLAAAVHAAVKHTGSETAAPAGSDDSGPVPLSPIQHWFFDTYGPLRHFTMSVLTELRADTDDKALAEAVAAVLARHDALRMRFRLAGKTAARWEAELGDPPDPMVRADLSGVPDPDQAIGQEAERARAGLDLAAGRLAAARLFTFGPGRPPRLLLVAHHLAVDAVSLRILLGDIETAYRQAASGQPVTLEPVATSFAAWSRALSAHVHAGGYDADAAFWAAQSGQPGQPGQPPGEPDPITTGATGATGQVSVRLGGATTNALLRRVPPVYRTRVNDVLLTALGRALSARAGGRGVAVTVEGHGRHGSVIAEGPGSHGAEDAAPDLTRTVGWFTAQYPVLLQVPEGDWGAALKSVKEQLRAVPHHGVSYEALRYLCPPGAPESPGTSGPAPRVRFNYHGVWNAASGPDSLYRGRPGSAGPDVDPAAPSPYPLDVIGLVTGGRLELTWLYSRDVHDEATVGRLARDTLRALREIVAHCAQPGAGGRTPSDFPLARLDQAAVDRIATSVRTTGGTTVEDIYPLTPLQAGMLFHALADTGDGVYVEQARITLDGVRDPQALAAAVQRVTDETPALRTEVIWEGVDAPLQVVRDRVSVPVSQHDWRNLPAAERGPRLGAVLDADRAAVADPGAAPLHRMAIVRLGGDRVLAIWTTHHLILDGWSMGQVFARVCEHYAAVTSGTGAEPAPRRPFRDYLRWLAGQDTARAEQFWRAELSGRQAPTPLPFDRRPAQAHRSKSISSERIVLTPQRTARLRELAGKAGLTVNTIVGGAWALLLARHSGEDDVVFGTTVSGRPAELAGAESMIGMFINTVPVRVTADPGAPVADWLRGLQDRQSQARQYDFVALPQIQAWTGGARFDSAVVFENYPYDRGAAASAGLTVTSVQGRDTTNFPLLVRAHLTDRLEINLAYDPELFEAATARGLLDRLQLILTLFGDDPGRPVRSVPWMPARERRLVLTEWNATSAPVPGGSLPELFLAQAARTPDAEAVLSGGESLSYSRLAARAGRLAAELLRLGLLAEGRVGVLLERSPAAIVSMLAVAMAGGAYVPLDTRAPADRLRAILAEAGVSILITDRAWESVARDLPPGPVVVAEDAVVAEALSGRAAGQTADTPVPDVRVDPDQLLYVMYTSGSTGAPKGVAVRHRDAVALAFDRRFGGHRRVLLHSPLAFDASTYELWVPLLRGGQVVVAPPGDVEPGVIKRLVSRYGLTAMWMTSGLFRLMASDAPDSLAGLDEVWTGGDVVPAEAVRAALRACPGLTVVDGYGPTETTTFATSFPMGDAGSVPGTVPIGGPLDNMACYVLDARLHPVPPGVAGELYLAGAGLARGYLGQPGLTASRFVACPFGEPGSRAYRTGDIVRWKASPQKATPGQLPPLPLPATPGRHPASPQPTSLGLPPGAGVLEFLGRSDDQVKVRGFRIELGEIEAALNRHPGVATSVVVAREEESAVKRLVGYVVPAPGSPGTGLPGAALDAAGLREHLAASLPDYMVPSAFVVLGTLPLDHNGKVSRRELPAPGPAGAAGSPYVPPRTEAERAIADAFSRVLGAERVGRCDNYFDLGGDSILSIRLAARLRETLGAQISPRTVFTHPTVAGLARACDAEAAPDTPPIALVPRDGELPASFAQRRLWFLHEFEPGSAEYVTFAAWRLRGELDVPALRGALTALVGRHESLRTTFGDTSSGGTSSGGTAGQPVQVVHPPSEAVLARHDLSALPEAERRAGLADIAAAASGDPFDLRSGPLLRASLVRLDDDDHVLMLALHHIITDGWSMGILAGELGVAYRAMLDRAEPPLPPLPRQYADYAAWQRQLLTGNVLDAQLGYWRRQLDGVPVLDLPADRARPPVRTGRGAMATFEVPADVAEGLKLLGRRHDATLFMVLVAACQLLFARWCGQDDVAVGTVVSGREHPGLDRMVGMFVNTLVLRSRVAGGQGFGDFLAAVRGTVLDAFAHAEAPFERIVDELAPVRDTSVTPLFQVMVALQNTPGTPPELPGLAVEEWLPPVRTAPFDLSIDFAERDGVLASLVQYSTDLFDPGTIDRLTGHLNVILAGIAAGPDRPLRQVPWMPPAERDQVLAWSHGDAAPEATGAFGELPEAGTHPLTTASASATPASMTPPATAPPASARAFPELFEDQARRAPQDTALVCDQVTLDYAALNTAANRLARHLITLGAGPEKVVAVALPRCAGWVVALLAAMKAGAVYLPVDPSLPDGRKAGVLADAAPSVVLDAVPGDTVLARYPGSDLTDAERGGPLRPGGAAYMIYTSGSTGKPKGVVVEHRGLASLHAAHTLGVLADPAATGRRLKVALTASFSFDASLEELVMMAAGHELHLITDEVRLDPRALVDYVATRGVDYLDLTPSYARQLLDAGLLNGPGHRPVVMLLGGEAVGEPLWRELAAEPGVAAYNYYGPTEFTVDAASCRIEGQAQPVIGRPLAGQRAYVLDQWLRLVPTGVAGELCLAGPQLARGYHARPDLTADRFVPDPCGPSGSRMYRTGDLARWNSRGELEYLGRADDQIKINGVRIEPGDIEAALLDHPGITEAVVTAQDRRLVAHLVAASPEPPDSARLRAWLRQRLPDSMVPSAFVTMSELPRGTSGKIDRNALPAAERETAPAYTAPRTPAERQLAAIWADVLGVPIVGIEDNFFGLGGDSILSIAVVSRAREAGLRVTPKDIFQYQNIAELAAAAGEPTPESPPAVPGPAAGDGGPAPLTPIQHWLLDGDGPVPHQFTMATLTELDPGPGDRVLSAALDAVTRHHPALRMRFTRDGGQWHQQAAAGQPAGSQTASNPASGCTTAGAQPTSGMTASGMTASEPLRRYDLSGLDEAGRRDAMERAAADAAAGLDIGRGPLLRAVLFTSGPGEPARLLLVVHHLVIDGVSWRILLNDLLTACRQLAAGEPVALPPTTTGYADWARLLTEHARAGRFDEELGYWSAVTASAPAGLPVDHSGGANTAGSVRTVVARLDQRETRALLRDVPEIYRTQINDVLLSAVGRALTTWTGHERVLIGLEGHGREEIADGIDLSRTVGWFTSEFPVALAMPAPNRTETGQSGTDWGAVLKSVKEQLRAVPGHGIGYGALRYLSEPGSAGAALRGDPAPAVTFNYHGQWDGAPDAGLGAGADDGTVRESLLDIVGGVREGRLELGWTYSPDVHDEATVERLARDTMQALREITVHCAQPGAGGRTPSDFPLARLDQAAVDRIATDGTTVEDIYPLTPLQAGMLFHALVDSSGAYTDQLCLGLSGVDDIRLLGEAWQRVVDATPVLRSHVVWDDVDEPVQVVRRGITVPVTYHDWRELPAGERAGALERLRADQRAGGFDLSECPLLRINLVALPEREAAMVWTSHHITTDGWSAGQIFADVCREYAALVAGGQAAPVTKGQAVPATGGQAAPVARRPFRDYLRWLAGQDPGQAEEFWRRELSGCARPTPLPFDRRPEQVHRAESAGSVRARLAPELSARLRDLARSSALTVNTIVSGAWALLLARHSGEDDVVFGTTVSGRPAELAGVESMIGMFINTVPSRVLVEPARTVVSYLRDLQDRQTQARQYDFAALSQIQSWAGGARFDSAVVFENYPYDAGPAASAGLTVTDVQAVDTTTFPLLLSAHLDDRIGLSLCYDPGLFDSATIERLSERLRVILTGFAEDPDRLLRQVPWVPTAERDQVLAWADGDTAPTPAGTAPEAGTSSLTAAPASAVPASTAADPTVCTFPGLFQDQARRTPHDTALVCDQDTLDYAALNTAANRLARHLITLGAGPEKVVAVALPRCADWVVALLAAMKAGAVYLPLDPSLPGDRKTAILADAAPAVVADTFPDDETLADYPGTDLDDAERGGPLHPGGAAYMIYTSGSTGKPKGVVVEHRCLPSLLAAHARGLLAHPAATTGRVKAALTASFSFDASWEQLVMMAAGHELHLITDETKLDPRALVDYVATRGVDFLDITPSYARQLLIAGLLDGPGHRPAMLMIAGEAIDEPLWRELAAAHDTACYNFYGPTEFTVDGTFCRIGDQAQPVIGRPLAGQRGYVLDERLRPVPPGVAGELCLAGPNLARGYHARPGLTADRFTADPYGPPGTRLYRTGDRVRWNARGELEYLGRTDDQVKIRGFRIEPGEVEAALAAHPAVAATAVVARQTVPPGNTVLSGSTGPPGSTGAHARLIGYLVPAPGHDVPSVEDLRGFLGRSLPDYMIPSAFVTLDRLPLTGTGKLDRRALPAPDSGLAAPSAKAFARPRTAAERAVAEAFGRVLGIERVGREDDFFALGGDSLLSIRVMSRLRATLGTDVSPRALFSSPTVAGLATKIQTVISRGDDPPYPPGHVRWESQHIGHASGAAVSGRPDTGGEPAGPGIPVVSRDGALPLSFAQQRLWFLHEFEPDSSEYVTFDGLRLRGDLDVTALRGALSALVARHESLRTTFGDIDGRGVQWVHPPREPVVPGEADTVVPGEADTVVPGEADTVVPGEADTVVPGEAEWPVIRDLTALPEADRHGELTQILAAEASRGFDLRSGPVLRATLVRLDSDDHVLTLALPHIVTDGWSMGILLAELGAVYSGLLSGEPAELPALGVQYADFAAWQHSRLAAAELDEDLAYWRRQLDGVPYLELPTDRPRPAVRTPDGAMCEFDVAPEVTGRLTELSQRHGGTLFTALVAACQVLLARCAGQDDIAVGTVTSGRDRPELQNLVGFFVNTLVLRSRVDGARTFEEFFADVKDTVLDAFSHAEAPFERVVEALQPVRDTSRTPLFQALVVLQNTPAEFGGLPGLRTDALAPSAVTTAYDLTVEFAPTDDGLHGAITYSTGLFDAATMERLAAHLRLLLHTIATSPGRLIADLPPVTGTERDSEPRRQDGTARPAPDRDIPSQFAAAPSARPGYVPPDTPVQRALAAIWAEVLGLERVGIDDNFFSLGGDSILSMQMVSRARQAGLGLATKALFTHQTIAGLAAVVTTVDDERAAVTGDVPLTPIQKWFFETHRVNPRHFHQSLLVELAPGLDEDALRRAVDALVTHHDALRTRFERRDGQWRQHIPAAAPETVFLRRELPGDTGDVTAAMAKAAGEARASLRLEDGHPFRVMLLTGCGVPCLFLVAHHLVVDGVSWRLLLDDLEVAYGQAARGEPVRLAAKTTSYRDWALRLSEHVASGGLDHELEHWEKTLADPGAGGPAGEPPAAGTRAPGSLADTTGPAADEPAADEPAADEPAEPDADVLARLSAEDTETLLRTAPAAFRTRIDDILLAALGWALARASGRSRVTIDLEGHGREEIGDEVDLSRTVGWFTTVFPVTLDVPADSGWTALVKSVRRQLRAVPGRGLGFGALRYLGPPQVRERLSAPGPEIIFNYLGQWDARSPEPGEGLVRGIREPLGSDQDPAEPGTHALDVSGAVRDGQLEVAFSRRPDRYDRAGVEALAADFGAALSQIARECRETAR